MFLLVVSFELPQKLHGSTHMPPEAGPPPVGNISSTYLLARTDLSDDEKLRVALARRQCWIRAVQFGAASMLLSYSAVAVAKRFVKLPRNSLTAVPLITGLASYTLGASYGAGEGAMFIPDVIAKVRGS